MLRSASLYRCFNIRGDSKWPTDPVDWRRFSQTLAVHNGLSRDQGAPKGEVSPAPPLRTLLG